MKGSRTVLLVVSGIVMLLVVGGGLGLKVGAADSSYRQVIHFSEVFSLVLDHYVDPVEADRLLSGAYEGMLGGLDSQGAYLTPAEVTRWKASAGGAPQAGPGLSVLKAFGALQIVGVDPDSPAARAGLAPGDQIRSIDGESLRDLSMEQALGLLRGAAGTSVSLVVLHPREDFSREELELTRVARTVRPYELTVRRGIAVLSVHDLERIDPDELAGELDDVRSRGVEQLLVDVRNVVEQDSRRVAPLAGLFVTGALLELKNRGGEVLEALASTRPATAWPGGIAVLVNGATAGAGEALARVLQVLRGAKVYGESTFGLGAEPRLYELPDGSGILVSAARWELPAGERWNGKGIEPDHEVRAPGLALEFDAALEKQLDETLDALTATASRDSEREAA